MNEVTRIRLGRIAYDIDINAKKELEKYSRAIRKSLGQDSDVYDDIEIRMTEILGRSRHPGRRSHHPERSTSHRKPTGSTRRLCQR